MGMPVQGADALSLVDLATDAEGRVAALVPGQDLGPTAEAALRRLADLGFVPGEYVRILARGVLGGEPLAVRIGRSTFALRRHEAACVRVTTSPR